MTRLTDDASTSDRPIDALKRDLFGIYYECGHNVRYIAESGQDRPYWANRYLQALKRAVDVGDAEVLAYVARMVCSPEPSRGFGYLKAAERLDLTVEALLIDASKPYHHLFDPDVVEAAVERLVDHDFLTPTQQPAPASPRGLSAEAVVATADGFAVELTVEITRAGAVVIHAGTHTETVQGTLEAVRTFVGLLADAEAAASAA